MSRAAITALMMISIGSLANAQKPPVADPAPPPASPTVSAATPAPVPVSPPPRLRIVRENVLARFGNVQVENRNINISSGIGRVGRVALNKSGATSLRFHFEIVTPADGWIVQVLRPTESGDEVVVWTISSETAETEFWTDEIAGGRARIEVLTFKPNSPLRLRLVRTMMNGPVSSPFSITGEDGRIHLRSDQPKIQQWSKIQHFGKSVARLRFVGDDGDAYFCTGFLITKDLILTNQHCIKSKREMRSALVDFDYLASTSPLRPETFREMLASDEELDYALFRLRRSVAVSPLKLKTAVPANGSQLLIIGHPLGEPKQVSIAKCEVNGFEVEGTAPGRRTDFGHLCDTLGGNSGSPVFDGLAAGEVVGLHHLGFTEESPDPVNQAVRIALVLEHIKSKVPSVAAEIP